MRILGPLVLMVLVTPVAIAEEPQSIDANRGDDWVYIQNDDLRVGLLRSHGGAMACLSPRNSEFNVLNH